MKLTKQDRLLFIMNLLRSRRNLNAELLASECGVTERTIYRDIISLSEANIPIYYDCGYKYASNNFMPPLNFNIDEYLTLKKILETTPLLKSGNSRQVIKSIASKIEGVLSPELKKQKMYSSPAPDVKIKSTISKKNVEAYLAILEHSIKSSNSVELKYYSIESGQTERIIDPYFLIFIERAFYFVGYCHTRKEVRTFRADRIREISKLNIKFKMPIDIDPQKYFEKSWGVFKGEELNVSIEFSGKAARVIMLGTHHPTETKIEKRGGKVLFRANVSGSQEIIKWILGFGGEAKVLKPKWLANKIVKISKEIVENY